VQGNAWLRGLRLFALVITLFAIKRIIDDTSWNVPPRVSITDATIATSRSVSSSSIVSPSPVVAARMNPSTGRPR